MTFHITCSTDDNYVQHCMAMLCSLFDNNKDKNFHVHLLIQTLSEKSRAYIISLCTKYGNHVTFYEIDEKLIGGFKLNDIDFNGKKMYSIATYFRFFLPSLLPQEVKRILYLDCDIVVLSDVFELYSFNMDNYGVAAVRDSTPYNSYHRYKMGLDLNHYAFCAGMMMINLDYWRKTNAQKKLIEYTTKPWKAVLMQDQDALNYVFRDSWIHLPYKWGRTPLAVAPADKAQRLFDVIEYVSHPCIIHYAAHVKPWLDVKFPLQEHYWKYVALSGFPTPQKTHANKKTRRMIMKSLLRYRINKYIRPVLPDLLEMLFWDIYHFFSLIINIFRPKRLKEWLLKRWSQKYWVI